MENMKFEITEKDIIEYLLLHKDDKDIKHKEALFVKYMKEWGIYSLTKETIEILMKKYNHLNVNATGIYDDKQRMMINPIYKFPDFNSYIYHCKRGIKDDIEICQIIIAIIKYYGYDDYDKWYRIDNDIDLELASKTALDNYRIANKVGFNDNIPIIIMKKEEAEQELYEYEKIYGESIHKIKKLVREKNDI